MESFRLLATIEQARNAAIAWLELRGVVFGPHRKIEIGRLGVMRGSEVGVSATQKPYWRLRLDYDPLKGPHFNAEVGEGTRREKMAFGFAGSVELMEKLARGRSPR